MPHNICDTVRLSLAYDKIEITAPEKFTPNAKLVENSHNSIQAFNNPPHDFIKNGGYAPRLTLSKQIRKGGYSLALLVEFSAPKMLFGNNFEEICDEDFESLVKQLKYCLFMQGVKVSTDVLRNAEVVGIHYGKNIPLNVNVSAILQELKRCNFNRYFDLSDTTHKNGGETVRLHTNYFELAWYDKVAECRKTSGRRCEEADGIYQNIDFRAWDNLQILRQEVRLNKKREIRKIFEKCGVEISELTFVNLFNSQISQKVNFHIFKQVQMARVSAALEQVEDFSSIAIELSEQKLKMPRILQIIGFLALNKTMDMREIRRLSGNTKSPFLKILIESLPDVVSGEDWFGNVFAQIGQIIEHNINIKE